MTTLELIVLFFLRAQIAGSAAVLIVLALRGPLRRVFGAEVAYRLWVLPLIAGMASLFPTLNQFVDRSLAIDIAWHGPWIGWRLLDHDAEQFLPAWGAGAAALALLMICGEWRFQRLMRRRLAGPAVVGVSWPRFVAPHDYRARFTEAERVFILEHEQVHMARKHPQANLLIAILQALSWFNPLAHIAAACARLDQELACDAIVIERHPRERRQYAEALIKAQVIGSSSPLACFLSAHPLELRIKQLAQKPVSLERYMAGVSTIAWVCLLTALVLWSVAPA